MSDVTNRITDYLMKGGNFNPEAMDHDTVRELLIDARDELRRIEGKGRAAAFMEAAHFCNDYYCEAYKITPHLVAKARAEELE